MTEHEVINVEGTVEEALPNSTFMVELSSGQTILAYLSGKMRKNFIKVMPGDKVKIELTPYDLTKGRIVSREKITY
ncbi:MAG: translation initiation factor IF-1 [Candidatus Berkelbacteria bacterium]|nr:translation initiation factor IF-1 [Candidatus Berkelbacteria bacterium]